MNTRLTLGVCALVCCLLIAGCDDPRKTQLQSQVDDLTAQKQTLVRSAMQERETITDLTQRRNLEAAAVNEYEASVQGYMMDHKMVVFALAAGVAGADVALDPNNEFTQDAKNVGGVVTAVAAIYALANLAEVSDVVKNLNEADAHFRTLQAGIAQTEADIQQQQQDLQINEGQIAELSQKIASLQAQLAKA